MTDVSIILCTANRAGQLGETLKSLASVRTPLPTELLVMDNRSVDRTRDVVVRGQGLDSRRGVCAACRCKGMHQPDFFLLRSRFCEWD